MNRRSKHIVLLTAAFSIVGSGIQGFAAQMESGLLVRNALNQPVQLEITHGPNLHAPDITSIQSRWEASLANVKVATLSKTVKLGVQVRADNNGKPGPELASCESASTTLSKSPRIAVIVYKQLESTHCSIVDLNTLQP